MLLEGVPAIGEIVADHIELGAIAANDMRAQRMQSTPWGHTLEEHDMALIS